LIHTWFDGSAWHNWENLGGPYPTSWGYGGANHAVDTTAELDAVESLLEDEDPAVASTAWAGLSPDDQARIQAYRPTINNAGDAQGGGNLSTNASAAVTAPDPSYINSIDLGSCGSAEGDGKGVSRPAPAGSGYPQVSRLSWKIKKIYTSGGRQVKVITVDIRVFPWMYDRPGLDVGLAIQTLQQVPGTTRSFPYKTANRRDDEQNRFPRKPYYYHASLHVFAGQNLYMRAETNWSPLEWTDAKGTQKFWYGDIFPVPEDIWYSCQA
jgi:hypothetical protein